MARIKLFLFLNVIFAFLFGHSTNGPKLRRICKSFTDNSIYFYPASDTCTKFNAYYIWGRDAASSPYVLIDSIFNKAADVYTHLGANPSGNPKKWSYFVVYNDSCSPPGTSYSDTGFVDVTAPDSTHIKWVSVNPTTNKVTVAWRGNQSPDFYRFLLYHDSLGNPGPVGPPVLTDTIYIDISAFADPSLSSITYDLTAMDSCGVTQVFGYNPHSTIYTTHSVDSCKSEVSINWTPYIGWPNIRSYYIYLDSGSGYFIKDSVPGNITTYTCSISGGIIYKIYIQANKESEEGFLSTSNGISFSMRLRKDPSQTYLANVTAIDPDANNLKIEILTKSGEEYTALRFAKSDVNTYPVFSTLQTIAYVSGTASITDQTNQRDIIQLYRVGGIGLCSNLTDQSNEAANMILTATGNGGVNSLVWNRYLGWDNGVNKYRIYRGTNSTGNLISYQLLDSLPSADSMYIDANPPEIVGDLGVCYYVEAIQNSGAPHGVSYESKSFSSCVIGKLVVFIPNAFTPNGANPVFIPKGTFIDYTNSTMEIYDRWGSQIALINDISSGWNGKSSSGITLETGVYLYRIKVVSTNGQQIIRKGTVTLLN